MGLDLAEESGGYRIYSSYDGRVLTDILPDLEAVRAWALADGYPPDFVDGLIETGWCPTALVVRTQDGQWKQWREGDDRG